VDVVTGAFSFTGRYVTARLLELGREVRTLTRKPEGASPFAGRVETLPLDFGDEAALVRNLKGAETLYNTYWIRFPRPGLGFDEAVANSLALLRAAGEAGVRRVVQLSVANAAFDSPFPYFRGKAAVEAALPDSVLSHAVVRPTLVFGRGEVLVNNIAWLLRRLPLFVVPGSGRYTVQPVAAEDVADLCVEAAETGDGLILDAAGPDILAFEELVGLVRHAIGSRARLVHGAPRLALTLARLVGKAGGETFVTSDELDGLMASLLVSAEPPRGTRHVADWLERSSATLGADLASDLRRPWA
jgi:NADH dehydrogenase